jgi:hypothetical protein
MVRVPLDVTVEDEKSRYPNWNLDSVENMGSALKACAARFYKLRDELKAASELAFNCAQYDIADHLNESSRLAAMVQFELHMAASDWSLLLKETRKSA